jgi:hypothetical protein
VRRQLTQQGIVYPPAFQQVNHFITQTQVCKIGVWVIFHFRQPLAFQLFRLFAG